jgi:C-terminal processing protease CtpA/Prc
MKRMFDNFQRMRQLPLVFVMAVVFGAGFALGNQTPISYAQTQFVQPNDVAREFEAFWQVYKLIREEYVDPENDPVETAMLVDGAIKGMVEALNDQNSGYMNPELYPVLFDDLSGAIEGIGVVIQNNTELGESR